MSETMPAPPKRRFAKRTNRGLRAASAATPNPTPAESAAPVPGPEVAAPALSVPAVETVPDTMDVASEAMPACETRSAPSDNERAPENDADTSVEAVQEEGPMRADDFTTASSEPFSFSSALDDCASADRLPDTIDVSAVSDTYKRSRDQHEAEDDAQVCEDSHAPPKKARIEHHDDDADTNNASVDANDDGASDIPDVEDRMDVVATGAGPADSSVDDAPHIPTESVDCDTHASDETTVDQGNRNVQHGEDIGYDDDEEEEAMRAYEASVAAFDCYMEATKHNGLKRLYVLIEYLKALVGGGHCASFEIGPETASLKHVTFGAMRKGRARAGALQPVEWTMRGGSVPVTKGTTTRPFGITVDSLVASPGILHALYADWEPAPLGQRPSSARERITLRLAITRGADRSGACGALAWLLDDCLTDADAQAALPPPGQRVSVHLGALWQRYLANDDIVKKAAVQAALYRCGMSRVPRAFARSDGAAPITPGLVAAS
nr:hypothetical protein [Pandoravirus massiliensis]